MNRRLLYLFLAAGIAAVFFGCSSKSSDEACIHEVTMNLDKGNYDAVLSSSCANDMQKGAAYFGLSGFDITDVINNLSKTGTTSSSPTNTQSDLTVYMTSLVTNATGTSLTYMDDAVSAYSNVTTTSGYTTDNYKDAQFYISLVDTVKGLSLIKLVIPNLLDASGNLNTACDYNDNSVPDDADATACALIAAARISTGATQTCSGATYAPAAPVDMILKDSSGNIVSAPTGTYPQTYYSGLTITITQVAGGNASACIPSGTTTYQKLLYKDPTTGLYWVATSSKDVCTDASNPSSTWPCPIVVQNNQPLDLVAAVDQTLTSSVSSLSSALTSSVTGTTDVQTAINDIQAQACCGCTTTPCAPCTTPCTSQNLANYLQTNLK